MIPRDTIEMINHRFSELVEQECSEVYEKTFVVNEYECTRNFGVPWAEAIYQKSAGGSNQEEIDSCIRSLIDQMKAKYAERQKNPSYVQISEILKKQDSVQIKARVDITDLTFQFTNYVSKLVDEVEQAFQCRAGNANYVHQMVWWINSQLYQFKMSKSVNTITYQVYSDRNGSEIHVDLFDMFGLVPEDQVSRTIKIKETNRDADLFSEIPEENDHLVISEETLMNYVAFITQYTDGKITRRCLSACFGSGMIVPVNKFLGWMKRQGYLVPTPNNAFIFQITDLALANVKREPVKINYDHYIHDLMADNSLWTPKGRNIMHEFLDKDLARLTPNMNHVGLSCVTNTLLIARCGKDLVLTKWGRHVIDQLKLQNKEESR